MKLKKNKRLKIPVWPIIRFEVIPLLIKAYLSQYWSWWGRYEIKFIKKFLDIHNAKYASVTVSGTMALEAALYALGIKSGDEVIVPAYTWISTATCVAKIGAVPVFVDVDPDTYCISPEKIEEAITDKTKCIIPVHLYSSMADMESIIEIAQKYNLKVIEDCAHAHGAIYKNKPAGTIADIGAFSFQQSKLLTSGEGGICITNNYDIAKKIDRFIHIGCSIYSKSHEKDYIMPYNKCNINEFQAAILSNQCDYLLKETIKREQNAVYLENLLKDIEVIKPQKASNGTERRSFYNFAFTVDIGKLKQPVSVHNLIHDLNEEGLPAQNGYGALVYNYILWNVDKNLYIKKDDTGAKKISDEIITFPHTLLLADKKTIRAAAQIIKKVVTKYL